MDALKYFLNFTLKNKNAVFWLGLNNLGQEDKWLWGFDQKMTVTYWDDTRENPAKKQHCGSFGTNVPGRWNSYPCGNYETGFAFCEEKFHPTTFRTYISIELFHSQEKMNWFQANEVGSLQKCSWYHLHLLTFLVVRRTSRPTS